MLPGQRFRAVYFWMWHKMSTTAINLKEIQLISGPDWVEPSGKGPIVLQKNTSTGETRLCWFDGYIWSYQYPGSSDFIF